MSHTDDRKNSGPSAPDVAAGGAATPDGRAGAWTPAVLRALFEPSPLSTVVYDAAGHVVAMNAAFERLFGLTLADVPGGYSILDDPQLAEAGYLADVRRAFAGEAVVLPPIHYEPGRFAGPQRAFWSQGHLFPVRDAGGALAAVVLVHMDLTVRMEAEAAAHRSEARLRVALEAGRMGAWEWDVAGGRVHWSETLQRIHGLVPGSFGGSFDEFQRDIHPDDRERVLAQITRSLDGAEHHLEYRIVRPGDGDVRWIEARGELFRDADGRPLRMLGVCADITARKRLQEETEAAQRRLAEQARELVEQAELLQSQARELEAQQTELESQAEELQAVNEELHQSNDQLAAALERAEEAEAFLSGILDGIGDPFVVQDGDWRFRYVNDAASAIFARSGHGGAGALIGASVWEAYPDLVGTDFEREMRRARDERVLTTFTAFYATTGRWSEMRCYPMPGGGLATLWKDVTEQKRSEEARHYLGRAAAILAGSLDADETARQLAQLLVPELADWCSIQLLDEGGTLRQVAVAHRDPAKVAWARELNERYPPDPDAATGAHEVVRTGAPLLYAEIPEALLVAGARDAEHLRIIRSIGFKSALIVPLAARGRTLGAMTLVAAESGRRYGDAELSLARELAGRAALAFDNATLYAAALRARAEADEANRVKSEFLANMSHELRTPLNAIGGYAQLLEMGIHGPLTEAQLDALRRVQRSQQHLLSLINDVLNFAKLEAGRVTYDVGPVVVAEVLGSLEALVAPQLAARRLRYECAPCPPELVASADGEKVQQILLNLLSNAIKFTPEGGHVGLSTRAGADAVAIAVADTGSGIPADKLDAVFEPFVQLPRKGAAAAEGTGLGLAISRDLARAMGGDLTVESTMEGGSTFTLSLPRWRAGAAS